MEVQEKINCVVEFLIESFDEARALDEKYSKRPGKPPLYGVPFSVKGNFYVSPPSNALKTRFSSRVMTAPSVWATFSINLSTGNALSSLIYDPREAYPSSIPTSLKLCWVSYAPTRSMGPPKIRMTRQELLEDRPVEKGLLLGLGGRLSGLVATWQGAWESLRICVGLFHWSQPKAGSSDLLKLVFRKTNCDEYPSRSSRPWSFGSILWILHP